eukprot:12960871-Heterocapsa_arctica.AAC.1
MKLCVYNPQSLLQAGRMEDMLELFKPCAIVALVGTCLQGGEEAAVHTKGQFHVVAWGRGNTSTRLSLLLNR